MDDLGTIGDTCRLFVRGWEFELFWTGLVFFFSFFLF